jgi:hypothetical protein
MSPHTMNISCDVGVKVKIDLLAKRGWKGLTADRGMIAKLMFAGN